jgi:hypothetical protein
VADAVAASDSLLDTDTKTVTLARADCDDDLTAVVERVGSKDARALALSGAESVAEREGLADIDGRAVSDACSEERAETVGCREATSVMLPKEAEAAADTRDVALPAALDECEDESLAVRVARYV